MAAAVMRIADGETGEDRKLRLVIMLSLAYLSAWAVVHWHVGS